jgi:hypothetical protein
MKTKPVALTLIASGTTNLHVAEPASHAAVEQGKSSANVRARYESVDRTGLQAASLGDIMKSWRRAAFAR